MGDKAPTFTLQSQNGPITLSSLSGQTTVLYFYPKADTPGCTMEACNFRDSLPQFTSMNATIIGVSKDSLTDLQKFSDKYNLNFTLASDESGKTCDAFGVMTDKSMYGKTYQGIDRSTFVIDGSGIIRGVWRKVTVDGHADAVRKTVSSLGSSTQQAA